MNALPIMHASADIESCRTPSNDERMATWAAKYFLRGHHRNPSKPRIRVTVPNPLASVPPADAEPVPQRAICGDYSEAREYAEAQSEPEPITSYADIRGV